MTLKLQKNDKPQSEIFDIACPKCKCDFIVPIMRIKYVRSFAGNRMQIEWPSKDGSNDFGVIACAACWEIFKVRSDGQIESLGRKLPARAK